jgi:MFS family permease
MFHLSMNRFLNLFNPDLPGKVWLLQFGVLVNFLGNGLVGPFLVIYLHFGRGIPIALAASAVALGGITAVTSGLVAGALADRLGPRNILVAGMLCNAAAYVRAAHAGDRTVAGVWRRSAGGSRHRCVWPQRAEPHRVDGVA